MTGLPPPETSHERDSSDALAESGGAPACVLSFNANDPAGAGGLGGDALVMGSVGAHLLPVMTGSYLRDSREAVGHAALDGAAIAEQAQLIAEDVPLQAVKVGFVGSAEAVAAVAAFVADYPELPVIVYMPDLSWWDEQQIDNYQDALRELLLPQAAVLVGNNTTLRHWLLPETASRRHADATDLARAAAELGVSYVLVTGLVRPGDRIGSVLASPQAELCQQEFERIEADFLGAGDTLSAALAGLLAMGSDLTEATIEALQYLDQALDHGFCPGMGRALPDRLFWAEADEPPAAGTAADTPAPADLTQVLHETKH